MAIRIGTFSPHPALVLLLRKTEYTGLQVVITFSKPLKLEEQLSGMDNSLFWNRTRCQHRWKSRAPDIIYINGAYYLYHSPSAFGKNTLAIGVMTNNTLDQTSPDYRWEDYGIIVQSIPGRDFWNAIDTNIL